ncbi:MAG: CDP-alcohol phosphatidyltransferase family protein, partial [Pseudomonadota bacterium]
MQEDMSVPPAKVVWVLVPPGTVSNDGILLAPFGGLPFILRQLRLAARTGPHELLLVGGPLQIRQFEALKSHSLAPKFRLVDLAEAHPKFVVSPVGPTIFVVQNADHVFEASFLMEYAEQVCANTGQHGGGHTVEQHYGIRACPLKELSRAIECASSDIGPNNTSVVNHPPWFIGRVHDRSSLQIAEHDQWQRCRKDVDGIISTHLNRHISLAISKMLVSTSITPNQITVFALLLGLTGVALITLLTYWTSLAGAVLLKAGSIIDGVDGELARMRVQSSVAGEWLDTISDDLVSLLFVLAIGYRGMVAGEHLWFYLSAFTASCMIAFSAIYYRWLAQLGSGNLLNFDWFAFRSDDENKN